MCALPSDLKYRARTDEEGGDPAKVRMLLLLLLLVLLLL